MKSSDKLFDVSTHIDSDYGPEDYQTGYALGRLAQEGIEVDGIDISLYTSPDPLDLLIAAEELELGDEE